MVAPAAKDSRDTYHHGDLRAALVAAAFCVLRERGLEGLTLREVARRAGVSHAAPYHHFTDRAALVATLVETSLLELGECMRAAAASAPDDPEARVRALGVAYVRFAVEDPAPFRLMFRPELRRAGGERLEAAGDASYRPLLEAIADGVARGSFVAGDVEDLGLAAWAAVHGLATLLLDGPLRDRLDEPVAVDAAVAAVVDGIVGGLLAR
jgi:AcrR family transcriptional regulator